MKGQFNEMCRKLKNQQGQGLVEYTLILVLIAVVVIAALTTLGGKTSNIVSSVNSSIAGTGK